MEKRGLCSYFKKRGAKMKVMRVAGVITAIILFIYTILLIGQIWGSWMNIENFIKLSITAGIVVIAVGIIALIFREYVEDKELKKEKYID